MATLNWTSQSTNEASLTYAATSAHPEITIPLYVTEYAMPVRAPKFQEVNTVEQPVIGASGGIHAGFFAAPEPLQTSLSGFTITPMSSTAWTPTANGLPTGTSLGLTAVNYPEIILAYMEGRMERDSQGAFIRKDPSQFVDPYGNVYSNVFVMTFEANLTVTPKKQTFSMGLWLGA